MNDSELLREYEWTGAGEAFAEIVRRHIDLVYSAAARQVKDGHLAEDVTQAVFVLLARKAGKVAGVNVAGWLFNTTRYAARNAMKIEARRRIRERQAAQRTATGGQDPGWAELSPELDEAVAELGKAEREVVLLHYFQGQKLAEVGVELGISEAAAKKRASRAIEKMRSFFAGRGFHVSATSMGAMMAAQAIQPAPGHLAGAVAAAIAGPGASTAAIVQGVVRMYTLAKVKLVAAVIVGPMLMAALILAADRIRPQAPSAGPTAASTQPVDDATFVVADLSNLTSYHIRQYDGTAANRLAYESLYDRARGVVTYTYYPQGVHITVNDGQTAWRFRSNGPLIGRRKSRATLAEVPVELAREIDDWVTRRKPVRDASADRIVDGVRWRCFRFAGNPEQGDDAYAMWVDSRHHIVRHVWTAGDGQVNETQVAYDVPVDPAKFPSTQQANRQVVELDRYLEKLFPLDNVVFMREACGMIFAVHHLEQDGQGRFHLICSTRPTEASRAALKPIDLFDYLGGAQVSESIVEGDRIVDSFPYSVEPIAEFGGSGMKVRYCVLVPSVVRPRFADWCGFSVRVRSVNALEAHLKTKSAATDEAFEVELEVPRGANPPALMDFAAQAYETASRLEGLINAGVMELATGPDNREGLRYRRSTQISKQDFLKNLSERVGGR